MESALASFSILFLESTLESNAPAVKDKFVSKEIILIYILKIRLVLPFPLPSDLGFIESAKLIAWKETSHKELFNSGKTTIITHHISICTRILVLVWCMKF